MKQLKYIVLVLATCFAWQTSGAQIKVAEGTETAERTGVIIHKDPRLAILEKKHRNIQLGVIRSGRGFRVQIYNGSDRREATGIKVDFMQRFPDVRTYMTYVQPKFRVKVGDYRTREEAMEMYRQASKLYSPCMIVPDIIVINTLDDE